jgi:hypothetical protein
MWVLLRRPPMLQHAILVDYAFLPCNLLPAPSRVHSGLHPRSVRDLTPYALKAHRANRPGAAASTAVSCGHVFEP